MATTIVKWLFIFISIIFIGLITYFYYNIGNFIFDYRIEGFIEMFLSSISLWISTMGFLLCEWIQYRKTKRMYITNIASYKKKNDEQKLWLTSLNYENEKMKKTNDEFKVRLNNDDLDIRRLQAKNSDITMWNSEKTTRIVELENKNIKLESDIKQIGGKLITITLLNEQLEEKIKMLPSKEKIILVKPIKKHKKK